MERFRLDQSVAQNLDYLPFGEVTSSDSGVTTHKFTGDERDGETGLDHTWFRKYSSQLGGGVRRTLPAYRTGRRG